MSRRQLGLFGAQELGLAIDDLPALRDLASRLPKHVRFGTSSWTFREWKSLVYVENDVRSPDFVRDSLEEYARHPLFRTVGIDQGSAVSPATGVRP